MRCMMTDGKALHDMDTACDGAAEEPASVFLPTNRWETCASRARDASSSRHSRSAKDTAHRKVMCKPRELHINFGSPHAQ